MPIPLIAGLGATSLGGLANSVSSWWTNNRQEKFSERMYDKQYADNVAFWNMQNEYNSPQAQMRRFQEAGLNPNLIYGQGNSGNAGAISTPDVQGVQYRDPQFGEGLNSAMSTMLQFADLQIKQAQADNLKAQNSVIVQDALLRAAQIRDTGVSADRKNFDLDFERSLVETSADARRELLRQMKVGTDLNISRDAREALSNSQSIAESLERMKNMLSQRETDAIRRSQSRAEINRIIEDTKRIRETIEILKKEGRIKEFDAFLSDQNIRPNDPVWYRSAGTIIDAIFNWWNK